MKQTLESRTGDSPKRGLLDIEALLKRFPIGRVDHAAVEFNMSRLRDNCDCDDFVYAHTDGSGVLRLCEIRRLDYNEESGRIVTPLGVGGGVTSARVYVRYARSGQILNPVPSISIDRIAGDMDWTVKMFKGDAVFCYSIGEFLKKINT